VSLGTVSLAGALALAIGRGSTAFVLLAAGASVITGVLGHLAPRPDPSEVIRPSKGEAF
jgi:hypothetical protein